MIKLNHVRWCFLVCFYVLIVKNALADNLKKNDLAKSSEFINNFEVINKSLVLVNGKVITQRQVQIYQEIKKLVDDQKKILNDLSDKDFLGTYLVDLLLCIEADQFGLAKISNENLKSELSLISSKIKGHEFLSQSKLSDLELFEVMTCILKSKIFLEFKISKFDSIVSSQEVEDEYKRNKSNYSNDREAAIIEIRNDLKQKRSLDQVQQWILFLKRKYKVQFLK